MPYKTGSWGEQAKKRYITRRKWFREYRKLHPARYSYKYKYKGKGDSLGYNGENEALQILIGSKKIIHPCDLFWEGKLIDVKTSRPIRIRNSETYRWKFLLTREKLTADLFLLICKDFEGKTKGIYLIPNNEIKGTNISFQESTQDKYKKYLLTL